MKLNALRSLGGLLRQSVGAQARQVCLLSDETVYRHYGRIATDALTAEGFEVWPIELVPGEDSKRLDMVAAIYEQFTAQRMLRDDVVVALGGGVVSDVGGFAAATWMRGIRFAICPTTVEAAVDASLGGKTGVNLPAGKNLVGAFHQPVLVVVDPATFTTLEARDVRAGLAESVKHGLIASADLFEWMQRHAEAVLALDPPLTESLIQQNIAVKGAIVEEDVHDRTGRRALLNFGHTIGHAIEHGGSFALRHGECVALGMLAACRISREMGRLQDDRVEAVGKLLERLGLPTRLAGHVGEDDIVGAITLDKKRHRGGLDMILLEDIGRPVIRHDIPEEVIRSAVASLRE